MERLIEYVAKRTLGDVFLKRMSDNGSEDRQSWLNGKTAGMTAVVAALLAAGHFLPVGAWFEHVNAWVESVGPAGPLIFAVIYAAGTVLLIPGSVMTIAAGALFGWRAIPVVTTGATVGAALAFLVARYLARERISRFAEQNARFKAVDGAIGEQGAKLIGLLRLSPVIPFNVSNYFYGLTSVGFWPYVLATFLGILPGACLYVYLGAAGKAGLDGAHQAHGRLEDIFLGAGLLATMAVTIIITRIARKALAKTG